MRKHLISLAFLGLSALVCARSQSDVIVITATFTPSVTEAAVLPTPVQGEPFDGTPFAPSAQPTAIPAAAIPVTQEHVVQAGDTLSGIAAAYGVSVETLQAVNDLDDPNSLYVGQVLRLPEAPAAEGPDFRILPDSRLVRAPGSIAFNVEAFIAQQDGYIRRASDLVNRQFLTAAQIVQRVSLEFSVDARLLLALLEFKSRWLTNPSPSEDEQVYPMGAPASPLGFDRNGLYRQLTWAADRLNAGYYGWKLGTLTTAEFEDGTRVRFASALNPGTAGVQYLLSQYNDYYTWQQQTSADGFHQTYRRLFGDPFTNPVEPLLPLGLEQPALGLPFPQGQTWFYTGGPHGGWGSGSAWAAIDFAPPDDLTTVRSSCYLSQYFVTAVAAGVIARTDEGTVILDLDFDGDESTGWTLLYLHIDRTDRIEAGTVVAPGDRIGRPSCEGGFSNGTHLHIARRYNGVWMPASCETCTDPSLFPPFVLGGWQAVGITGQEYQGFLRSGGQRRVAEQGRQITDNQVSW